MAPSVPNPTKAQEEEFKSQKHSAFIIGYTGETGKTLVAELNERKLFDKVVLIGRRETQLNVGPEFVQKVINLDNVDEHKTAVQGCDVGFCCLGTTRGKAGKEGFIKVDKDYVLHSGEAAKAEGCKFFNVMSSMGVSDKSMFLYGRIKGEVEEALKKMQFDRLNIIRPGLIMVDREESRTGEAIMRAIWKPISALFPSGGGSIPTHKISQGMVNAVISSTVRNGPKPEVNVIENGALHTLADSFKEQDKK